jgi:hypothetical protein
LPTPLELTDGLGDFSYVHFGGVGSTLVIRSPADDVMTATFQPAAGDCPAGLQDCPVVAKIDFAGRVEGVWRADDRSQSLPIGDVAVACTQRLDGHECLDQTAADGTWVLMPARNEQGRSAGMLVSVRGEVFRDVDAATSGDIETTGSGMDSANPFAIARIWNWQVQHAEGESTYDACGEGLPALCNLDGPPEERLALMQVPYVML